MRTFLIASVAVAAVAVAAAGCRRVPTSRARPAEAPAGDWPGFVNGFIEASFKANPGFAVVAGPARI